MQHVSVDNIVSTGYIGLVPPISNQRKHPMNLINNTIVITGGGSGIGRGLAEAFHALGNQVIIGGRRTSVLDEVTAANPGMKSLELDAARPESIISFANQIIDENPAVNVLINNAGIT